MYSHQDILNKISFIPYFPYLTLNSKELFYFVGFTGSLGCLFVLNSEEYYFYTDARYYEMSCSKIGSTAKLLAKGHNVADFEYLTSIVKEREIKKIYFHLQYYSYTTIQNLQSFIDNNKLELLSMGSTIESIMENKTEQEISYIKRAQEITEKSIAGVIGYFKEGVSEQEIVIELEYLMRKQGALSSSFSSIVLFGEKTSLPHGQPSYNRKLKKDEIILIDAGSQYKGYCSDMTRMFFFGDIRRKDNFLQYYNILLFIQKSIIEFIEEGMMVSELALYANSLLDNYKLLPYFTHSLGHGIGIDVHEKPYIKETSTDKFHKNLVFTVEPGIYFEGKYGMRIEDLVYIDKYGKIQIISQFPKEILLL